MKGKLLTLGGALALALLVFAGCGEGSAAPAGAATATPAGTTGQPTTPQASMPNPASVYCEQQGGRVEIRTAADGSQYGVCIFPDGSECDEWKFFRGECTPKGWTPQPTAAPSGQAGMANPASVHCEEHGGKVEMRTDANGGVYGVCIFPDGSECEEWKFFRGECKPG